MEAPDRVGDPNKLKALGDTKYFPPLDPMYIYKNSPTTCGKLLLALRVKLEEFELDFANSHRIFFATAHMYNGLRQSGLLQYRWPEMEAIISRHIHPIFMGELPVTTEAMHNRMMLAAGYGTAWVMGTGPLSEARRLMINSSKWDLQPNPVIRIIRDYLNDEEPLIRVLYQLDAHLTLFES
ncbi:hypothetical protein BS50DRAFT_578256 [Corynespora cassiicola Philippines]|uniref:Uncharacterized protein n=1 Tax=Corynespora cassiicola Philippines TaxID=1448308 RepID=A0A2T2N8J2_CORCC|nr:hypothetical protein BS50DRAFT_578256 [Corynespora cassiicola Philippines]